MKIAHLQLLPLMTGVQRVTMDELERLDQTFEKKIICKEFGKMIEEAQLKNIDYNYIPELVREISPINDLVAFIKSFKIFRKEKFDIVHTHSSKTGVIGRVAAILAGVPFVVHTVHGYSFPAAKSKLQYALYFALEWVGAKCSDCIICLHEDDAKITVKKLGVSPYKVKIIPNGVETTKFYQDDEQRYQMREEMLFEKDDIVITMTGRLWEQKNPMVLIKAANEVINKHNKKVKFVFVGDGDLKDEMESYIAEHNLTGSVNLLGWRDDVPSILKASDIFVLPSLWEGMPLAILEAMATGLPCVVSNITGNDKLIYENENGYLFEPSNDKDLANKLIDLIDNKEKRKTFGARSRKQVELRFDINKRVVEISELYKTKNQPIKLTELLAK